METEQFKEDYIKAAKAIKERLKSFYSNNLDIAEDRLCSNPVDMFISPTIFFAATILDDFKDHLSGALEEIKAISFLKTTPHAKKARVSCSNMLIQLNATTETLNDIIKEMNEVVINTSKYNNHRGGFPWKLNN